MTYNVYLSAPAEEDLSAIYEYIAFELREPGTAAKLIDRMEAEINSLSEMPYRYRAYDAEPWRSKGLRQMAVGNYIVLYVPNDHTANVEIVRIFYGGRDIEAELK